MIALLFVLSTLVGSSYGDDHDQHVKDYNALQTVFGKHRLNTHFPTSSGLIELQERKLSSTADDEVSMHIVCSTFSDAGFTETMLNAKFGKNNVHPAYTSSSQNSVCFVTATQYSEARQMKGNKLLSSVTSVPPTMKIHESVMFVLGLVDANSDSYPVLKQLYGREKQTIDLEFTTLAVSNGVGVKSKTLATGGGIRENDIKDLLVSSPASTHLTKLAKASGHEDSVWHKHIASTDKLASCNFDALSYHHTGHSIHIGNLHEIAKSESSETCFATLLAILAAHSSTADIRFNTPKKTSNYIIRGIMQAEAAVQTYPYTNVGIDGTGQVVGIGDTGVDELSCFFRNSDSSKVARSSYKNPTYDNTKRKVIQYVSYADDSDTEGGHGTHVSGTVGGALMYDSTTYLNYNGHASGAKIAFFDMEKSNHPEYGIIYPSPIGDNVFQAAYDAGARLHSNSWGGPYNLYDDDTLDTDDYHNTHPDFLVLFAAGNDGSEGYYSLGDPAVSKNALTVGCSKSGSSDMEKIAFFSSLGPTFDERIKPDVVAPGYFTYSAKAAGSNTETCNILSMAGTSMATPAVAGAAAQIRQYFKDYDSGTMPFDNGCSYFTTSGSSFTSSTCNSQPNPRGATVKAMLVNSGEAMTTYYTVGYDTTEPQITLAAPPDMYQGFGRVSLMNILPYPGIEEILEVHVIEMSVTTMQQFTHTVTVGDASRPFKATLVWMDPTNSAVTQKMLINNLDLEVEETTTGTVYYGNGNGADDVNNVEQVSISVPSTSGSYKVRVTAGSYLFGSSQTFSLIVTGGDLTFTSDAKATISEYNPLDCSSNERLVRVTAMDREADGWASTQKYRIAGTDNSYVLEGTMTGADKQDFMSTLSLCLPTGSFTVSLSNTASSGDLGGMAFEVDTCNIYLSEYQPSASFTITSATTDYCGTCSGYGVSLLLAGSFYGVPYGWNDDSHYQLSQTKGGDTVYMGTLATGMVREHKYCLGDGTYTLAMKDIPKSDDFLDDDYLANYFGVEEYRIYFSDTDDNAKTISSKDILTITVSGGSGDISTSTSSGGSDDDDKSTLSTGAAVGIAIAVIVVIGAIVAGIVYCACCRNGDDSKPLATSNIAGVGMGPK